MLPSRTPRAFAITALVLNFLLAVVMLLGPARWAHAVVSGGIDYVAQSATTTGGTVAAGATLSAGINYTAKSAAGSDAINKVELREGSTVLNSITYTVTVDKWGEPVNTQRNGTRTASLGIGTHQIYLRAYTQGGATGDSATYTVAVLGPAVPPPLAVAGQTPHILNADAGTLPGNLAMAGGAATYSIPLAVPPGTAGLAPALSLNYSSQGSNGQLGVGWSLSGLSSIHRCSKTIAQDGVPGRISFDTADRLCLDSVRLVLASAGANPADDAAYWAAGAQYRTEQESFARITRQANGGFKVESRGGRINYYGSDTGSLIRAQGRSDGHPSSTPTHTKMSTQALGSDRVHDILLRPAQLYEALGAKSGGAAAAP